jgi:hypothetical protein
MLINERIKHYIIFIFKLNNLSKLLSNNYNGLIQFKTLSEKQIIWFVLREFQYYNYNLNLYIKLVLFNKTNLNYKLSGSVNIISTNLNDNLCYLIWAYYYGFIVLEKI